MDKFPWLVLDFFGYNMYLHKIRYGKSMYDIFTIDENESEVAYLAVCRQFVFVNGSKSASIGK
ncbi:hypothetical protein [Labilibaculum manganireducens]|uniref:hypothetical protein n=1 Tax=Labilibaculum manganireducens TaxID=1940525 RepID=UPI0029F4EF83|nr:hypothetical protein [Labilibaculum manganireducens]